ncbi:PIN domain-containing protein [Mesorhizobium sp. PUT5]|uniref:PIN domain-containing protein n=1 Tax=Mesorhizobium sp. PUT5 TaxID=3454629 RepID=UPI003FA41345
MPGARVFIDTNILLYSHDRKNGEKAARAQLWLRELAKRRIAAINLQVLNELTHVLLRKKWFGTPEQVFSTAADFAEFGDSPLTKREVAEARSLHLHHGYSWWDCLLLASAIELGCSHFLSEDLQDGHAIQGLTIIDPFAHSPEQILNPR